MGFWSKLGKVALKVAPIATAFIPGVGPLLSAAIGGATSAASKKIEGGSWKDALISGGIGAGTSFGLDKITAAKGLGTTKAGAMAAKAAKTSTAAGTAASAAAKSPSILGKIGTAGKVLAGSSAALGTLGALKGASSSSSGKTTSSGGTSTGVGRIGTGDPRVAKKLQRGLGPVMGQLDQSRPNLSESIGMGRIDAMRNQPWRSGYDVNYLGSDGTTPLTQKMNPIYPMLGGKKKQKKTSILSEANA